MEWFVFILMGFMIWRLSRQLQTLEDKIERLEQARPEQAEPERHETPPTATDAKPAHRDDPSLALPLTEIVPPAPEPVPEPAPQPTSEQMPEPMPELVLDLPVSDQSAFDQPILTRPEPARPRTQTLALWLAENGMAWLGGGALAIGSALLVGYAAQAGFFTPLMRVWAACALGFVMIGVSEWMRRAALHSQRGHPLAAALVAGAGAVALYAAIWAAHGLFHMLGAGWAAILLAACAALLMGLSFLHGQPLAVLAVAFAFLTPLLSDKTQWSENALTLYLLALVAAGSLVAAFRGWTLVIGATMFSAYLWYSVSLADNAHIRAILLLVATAIGACAIVLRPLQDETDPDAPDWGEARAMAPSIGVAVSGILVIFDWVAIVGGGNVAPMIAAPALAGGAIALLGALARRAHRVDRWSAAATILALPIGYAAYAFFRGFVAPLGLDYSAWAFFAAGMAALTSVFANPRGAGRMLIASTGAASALALVLLGVFPFDDWGAISVWSSLAIAALLFFACAWQCARGAEKPQEDGAVFVWVAASAGALLFALNSLSPPLVEPISVAGAALLFAFAYERLRWRAWSVATVSAAAIALAHCLSPSVFGAALERPALLPNALTAISVAGLLILAASWVMRTRAKLTDIADALSSASILVALTGAFLILNWFAADGAPMRINAFLETSLGALVLIASGAILITSTKENAGLLSRARGHALIGAGALYALFEPAFTQNPWWGFPPAAIVGPPLINALAIAFAAPAALLAFAAAKSYAQHPILARLYASASGFFALLWVLLEIRRAFHGAQMALNPIGLLEGDVYALVLLAAAVITAWRAARASAPSHPFAADLAHIIKPTIWIATILAAVILMISRCAFWESDSGLDTGAVQTFFATAAHALAALLCFALASRTGAGATRTLTTLLTALFALSFGALAIRWGAHQGAMDDGVAIAGLEGLLLSLWPLVWRLALGLIAKRDARFAPIASGASWPTLIVSAAGLWILFAPWWGLYEAHLRSVTEALVGVACYLAAAWACARLSSHAKAPLPRAFATTASAFAIAHIFAALTLIVRRAFHGPDMVTELADAAMETWTYSAVWALFGAIILALGALRRGQVMLWSGLVILFGSTLKVVLIDMAALDGLIRAASVLVLGAIGVAAAVATRRISTR